MKRLLAFLSFGALALVLVQTGFVATLAVRGGLKKERFSTIMRTLRGDAPELPMPASAPATQPAASMPASRPVAWDDESLAIRALQLDRREREIADQWKSLREAQIAMVRERETLESERKRMAQALKQQAEQAALSGAAKELEYLSSIKAEIARELMQQKKEPDVVALLLQMDTRTGRKIIESCKTDDQRQWIGRILEQLRRRNENQAEALGGDN